MHEYRRSQPERVKTESLELLKAEEQVSEGFKAKNEDTTKGNSIIKQHEITHHTECTLHIIGLHLTFCAKPLDLRSVK